MITHHTTLQTGIEANKTIGVASDISWPSVETSYAEKKIWIKANHYCSEF